MLTSINMLSWAIPLRNKNFSKNTKLLGLANSFAGGIFLMLAFGHMLPHSVAVLTSIGKDVNLSFQCTLLGYLLVFFIEKIAFDSHAILHDVMDSDVNGEICLDHRDSQHVGENNHDHGHGHIITPLHSIESVDNMLSSNMDVGDIGGIGGMGGVSPMERAAQYQENKGVAPVGPSLQPVSDHSHKGHSHGTNEGTSSSHALSPKSAIILLAAMSVHR